MCVCARGAWLPINQAAAAAASLGDLDLLFALFVVANDSICAASLWAFIIQVVGAVVVVVVVELVGAQIKLIVGVQCPPMLLLLLGQVGVVRVGVAVVCMIRVICVVCMLLVLLVAGERCVWGRRHWGWDWHCCCRKRINVHQSVDCKWCTKTARKQTVSRCCHSNLFHFSFLQTFLFCSPILEPNFNLCLTQCKITRKLCSLCYG